jgi:hypothetical protein
MIHHPAFYLKYGISEIGFCISLQVVTTQMSPIKTVFFPETGFCLSFQIVPT